MYVSGFPDLPRVAYVSGVARSGMQHWIFVFLLVLTIDIDPEEVYFFLLTI